eukprot:342769-Rhodomonas_salina.2
MATTMRVVLSGGRGSVRVMMMPKMGSALPLPLHPFPSSLSLRSLASCTIGSSGASFASKSGSFAPQNGCTASILGRNSTALMLSKPGSSAQRGFTTRVGPSAASFQELA